MNDAPLDERCPDVPAGATCHRMWPVGLESADTHPPGLTALRGGHPAKGGGVNSVDELAAMALLTEPVRLELYRYLRGNPEPVGREEAARVAGISVKLAAFHLDRMVEAGMLDASYRRLTGRTGPGAGRPAKVYTVSPQRFAVSLPKTRYSLAASIMATALSAVHDGSDGADAVRDVARSMGQDFGGEIREEAPTEDARRGALFSCLDQLGYEPRRHGSEVSLGNCIFADLVKDHRDIVCSMNAALMNGLLEGVDLPDLRVESRSPEPGCCACFVTRMAS